MLHAILPTSIKSFSIRPSHDTLSLFLVIKKATLIYSTISVDEHTLTVHLVVFEDSLVAATTRPYVLSKSFHLVVRESTLIARLIEHTELSVAVT